MIASAPGRRTVPAISEMRRILELDTSLVLDEGDVETFSRDELLRPAFDQGFRFFREQVEAILAYDRCDGLVAPLAVGAGKTGVSLAIAARAYRGGLDRVALVIPSSVVGQLLDRDIPFWRTKIDLPFEVHVLAGRGPAQRKELLERRPRGVYVLTYGLMSSRDATEMLEAALFDWFILDEAHKLARRSAARTRRFVHHAQETRPEVVLLSGTLSSKSLLEYGHLARLSLRAESPLPNHVQVLSDWSSVIDSSAEGPPSLLGPLVRWAGGRASNPSRKAAREAFSKRFRSSPGVASSPAAHVGASILVENVEAPPPGPELVDLVEKLEKLWIAPNGDELEHAIRQYAYRVQLTSGIYYDLRWPPEARVARLRACSAREARSLLLRSEAHHEAQQAYHKVLRAWFQYAPYRPGIDTPFLVGASMKRDGSRFVGRDVYGAWINLHELDFEGRLERDSVPVRVDGYKVRACAEWARKHKRGIVWFRHLELGQWLREEIPGALFAPSGKAGSKVIAESKGRIVVASFSHGTGKNLQFHDRNLLAEWPRPANQAEQIVGRTHRPGQLSDEVLVATLLVDDFDRACQAATLWDATYLKESLGSRQKLLVASYDPVPATFTYLELRARGLQPKKVNI